jgi:hypothetical protein
MPDAALGEVMVERTLLLDGAPTVVVRIGRPEMADGPTWICRYAIEGLSLVTPDHTYGVDALQALLMAVYSVRGFLAASQEAKSGRLSWLGDTGDFGFSFPHEGATRAEKTRRLLEISARFSAGPPHDFDTLAMWSTLSDEELRQLFSPQAQAALRRMIALLLDADVFEPIDRQRFPAVVRIVEATLREGSHRLSEAMLTAADYRDSGRQKAFEDMMQEFIDRSPTRFHRQIAENYLNGTRPDGGR